MLTAYILDQITCKPCLITAANQALLKTAIWIDMFQPTSEEEQWVETATQLNIPTREEMQEIEVSSRYYKEADGTFMTVTMLINADSNEPKMDAVTFIITPKQFISLHYLEPQSFILFKSQIGNLKPSEHAARNIMVGLFEAIIDRMADILEKVGAQLDSYSQAIFRQPATKHKHKKPDFKKTMQDIGNNGDLSAKARESLMTFTRLITYFQLNEGDKLEQDIVARLTTLNKDISSLNDHLNFLSSQVNFLLNATLGMISIDQNNIIRIFTIGAVFFLPPTLIASIYGMNFTYMPELHFKYAYPVVLFIMALTTILPYSYFKRRKWL